MTSATIRRTAGALLVGLICSATPQFLPAAGDTTRPWTRWWWPGSAVDEANLTAQLESFAAAGLGGVEITPIYGARGYEDRYVEFLSPRWMELLEHAGREAGRLGLGLDMATGTGWPFGGPGVPAGDAAQRLVLADQHLGLEPTGQMVKRAAPGGEGLVLDPYSAGALGRYLVDFDAAFAGIPPELVRSQFHDSFEYYGATGTRALEPAFATLHGYRLNDWAAVLMGTQQADPDSVARLKGDYRATLDHLHQAYLQRWADWAHRHGWLTRNQSHGAPANLLDLYAIADIPETEIFGSTPFAIPGLRRAPEAVRSGSDLPEPLVSRMASSAAHVMGKPLVSCETATWLREHWKVALSHVKPELDRVWLDGINHVFYHGTVYSPADAAWPGWLFYASTQFNPNNPWWRDFAALNAYVSRVQEVLQGGKPDNPVLLYWPVHDIWHDEAGLVKQLTVHDPAFITGTATGQAARALHQAGIAFDYVSDRQLMAATAAGGLILCPGSAYAAVVVPPTRHMPASTLAALQSLAHTGGTVIFARLPEDVPGMGRLAARRAAFREIIASFTFPETGEGGLSEATAGAGRLLLGDPVAALARVRQVHPEPMVAGGLDFIRRATSHGRDYFIANLGAQAVEDWIELGTPATGALFLDPLTGASGVAGLRHGKTGSASVYLQLAPGESLVIRTREDARIQGAPWPYLEPAGEPVQLTGPWAVHFVAGGPVIPQAYQLEQPASWADGADPDRDRFAGTACYSISFERPETAADDWLLDLGDVRESARVRLNGECLGTVWSIPFRLRLGGALRAGRNVLEIEVTNTAANRIRDLDQRGVDWKIMREINFVNIDYRPFDASGWELEPAGLLGPVSLQPLRSKDILATR